MNNLCQLLIDPLTAHGFKMLYKINNIDKFGKSIEIVINALYMNKLKLL